MTDKNGGAAFPVPMSQQSYDNQKCAPYQTGMDLRDYLASKALPIFLANAGDEENLYIVAQKSYEMADAMIAAR